MKAEINQLRKEKIIMQLEYRKARIQDLVLGIIIDNSSFPLSEIHNAYVRLRSYDRLLEAIDTAMQERRSLEAVVDVMLEAGGN